MSRKLQSEGRGEVIQGVERVGLEIWYLIKKKFEVGVWTPHLDPPGVPRRD